MGKLQAFDVSAQIQTDTHMLVRVPCVRAGTHANELTIRCKDLITTDSISSIKWFQTAGAFIKRVVNVWKRIDNVFKWFANGLATHFSSVEERCQCFKTQWKCSSTLFQCVENALQRKNASTLFSLSLLFPNRVTNDDYDDDDDNDVEDDDDHDD